MKITLSKIFLCAAIGAVFSTSVHAQENPSTSITVLLKTTIASLSADAGVQKNVPAAVLQLQDRTLRIDPVYRVPLSFSAANVAAMERHNLTRYYSIDTSHKSAAEIQTLLVELKRSPLVELAQMTPVPLSMDHRVGVIPAATGPLAMRNGIADYRSHQHYMHGLDPAEGYKVGGLDAIAARAYPGGYGEKARIISMEGSHWFYDHIDLPQPFIKHWNLEAHRMGFHDTMSAGIMFSKNNGFGTTGFAPEAKAGYSKFGQGGLFDLAQYLIPGDVLQLGVQYGIGGMPSDVCGVVCHLPVEYNAAIASEIAYLTEERGVHVIMAGANGNVNLDHPYFDGWYDRNTRDTGGIYVGAAHAKLGDRADFSDYGNRIDLFSWGNNVMTTTTSETEPNGYSHFYEGTSAANPIIAGAVAQIQSIAFEAGLGAIPPKRMRQVLVDTGHPLAHPDPLRPIGMQPDIPAAVEKLLAEADIPLPVAILSGSGTAQANAEVTLTAAASSDPEGQSLTYKWIVPAGIRAQRNDATLHFTAPELAADQQFVFSVEVSNGVKTAMAKHSVTIQKNAAGALTANVKGPTIASALVNVTLTADKSTDPQNRELTYKWSIPTGIEAKQDGAKLTFIAPTLMATQAFSFRVQVDNGQSIANAFHTVTVQHKNIGVAVVYPIYVERNKYLKGDIVKNVGALYECIHAGSCGGDARFYAPGTGSHWDHAWKTFQPNISEYATYAPNTDYITGQVVQNQGILYTCIGGASCGGLTAFYAPGSGSHWRDAWTLYQPEKLITPEITPQVNDICQDISQWQGKPYKGGDQVLNDGRSYTAKWSTEAHHTPGSSGWLGEPWELNGTCK